MADGISARGARGYSAGERAEHFYTSIEYFNSLPGQIYINEIREKMGALVQDLLQKETSRDSDMYLKGQIAELQYVLDIPNSYIRKTREAEKKEGENK